MLWNSKIENVYICMFFICKDKRKLLVIKFVVLCYCFYGKEEV